MYRYFTIVFLAFAFACRPSPKDYSKVNTTKLAEFIPVLSTLIVSKDCATLYDFHTPAKVRGLTSKTEFLKFCLTNLSQKRIELFKKSLSTIRKYLDKKSNPPPGNIEIAKLTKTSIQANITLKDLNLGIGQKINSKVNLGIRREKGLWVLMELEVL